MNQNNIAASPFSLLKEMKKPPTLILSEEKILIDRCINKDRLAQKEFYGQYYNMIFGVCLKYANDRADAKSWTNLSFLKIFQSLHKYQLKGAFAGWIKRIAVNICIDEIRKNKRYKQLIDDTTDIIDNDTVLENSLLDNIDTTKLYAMIQQLPPVSRSVFCLFVLDDYKHREIADMLSISQGTSRWHLSNAKQILRKKFSGKL